MPESVGRGPIAVSTIADWDISSLKNPESKGNRNIGIMAMPAANTA